MNITIKYGDSVTIKVLDERGRVSFSLIPGAKAVCFRPRHGKRVYALDPNVLEAASRLAANSRSRKAT